MATGGHEMTSDSRVTVLRSPRPTVKVNTDAGATIVKVSVPSQPRTVKVTTVGPQGVNYPAPWVGTQVEYDALQTYDPDRFYLIT